MYLKRHWLLTFLTCVASFSLHAETSVSVEIRGIGTELEKNVRQYLSIEQQKSHALLSPARLQRLQEKAPAEIKKALQPFGYYKPTIKTELESTPDQWKVIYSIDPGPPLPIAEFNFKVSDPIAKDPVFQKLINSIKMGPGRPFSHIEYEKLKSDMTRIAAERGYIAAHFETHRVEVNLHTYAAKIQLHFAGGPQYHFGEVKLEQNVLNPALVNRYIPFAQGTLYNLNKLVEFQQALNDSDYFQTVEVSPGQADLSAATVPIIVHLTPRKPNRLSFGIGYGSDTGTRGKAAWEIVRLNPAGHRTKTETMVSEIGYRASFNYQIPIFDPRTDQLVYSAAAVNERTDTSDSTLYSVGANLNHSRSAWRETLSLNYQQEEFEIASERGVSSLLIPSANWSRTWGNRHIFTFDGVRTLLGIRGAGSKLASDTSFYQMHGSIKAIHSLGDHHRIISRGKLGGTYTDGFNQLPPSVRFFAGGSQSVRGYAYQSLGPTDTSGKVVGGKHIMVGSVEWEYHFDPKWSVALFYDAGNAINSLADELEHGTGFGIRWQSPVGPLRMDFGHAISHEERPWRVHINIGPDL